MIGCVGCSLRQRPPAVLWQVQADHTAGKLQLGWGISRPASITGCLKVLGGVAPVAGALDGGHATGTLWHS